MKTTRWTLWDGRIAPLVLAAVLWVASASAQAPEIPIVEGLNIVLAVANSTPSEGGPAGVLQGDYEMVVSISGVAANGITHTAWFEGTDAAGVERKGGVKRVVSDADLKTAAVQIFGFHLDDPPRANGTTALGPSLGVTRELVQKGAAAYSFRQWVGRDTISGTLRRSANSPIKFPVLLNGKRVELDAILATGQMGLGGATRPFETAILDHPRYPISLRIAYGPRNGGFPFKPDFIREVVRIDFSAPQRIADALGRDCRVELKGVYFDFNKATLQPQSEPALQEIANALKTTKRRVTIEGHTDNIGSDAYNNDLSTRRAAAVKAALVRDHGVDGVVLTTAGYGERRPVESNDSLSGRARNRRVELVCASDKR